MEPIRTISTISCNFVDNNIKKTSFSATTRRSRTKHSIHILNTYYHLLNRFRMGFPKIYINRRIIPKAN